MTIKKKITDAEPVLSKYAEDGVIIFMPDDTISLLGSVDCQVKLTHFFVEN